MLKFLVDESSGKKLSKTLANQGFDVKFVTEIMAGAKGPEVLAFAVKEGRILVTNDKDFGELVFRLKQPSSGVILLRPKFDIPRRRIAILVELIKRLEDKLERHFVVATDSKYRVRKIVE